MAIPKIPVTLKRGEETKYLFDFPAKVLLYYDLMNYFHAAFRRAMLFERIDLHPAWKASGHDEMTENEYAEFVELVTKIDQLGGYVESLYEIALSRANTARLEAKNKEKEE